MDVKNCKCYVYYQQLHVIKPSQSSYCPSRVKQIYQTMLFVNNCVYEYMPNVPKMIKKYTSLNLGNRYMLRFENSQDTIPDFIFRLLSTFVDSE